ncbi:MAG: 30S ribosomal protein S12 methylthiotransferase RimO [Bacteroidetes bacterium]|nr:MAG: 30S ribosomal protein S12 methylthiotransferase RimO [Bacteroidota bacterium]
MAKINIITLGCSKNLVDSENLATQINNQNVEFTFDEFNFDADTVVINTCGFIADAKEESINTILEFAEAKKTGKIDNLYVMGCLSERYKDELLKEIEDVDKFFGVNDMKEIVEQLKIDYKKELLGERVISTPSHFAYLKISEGCDRTCAFCAIPKIRGKHVSVPMELLISQTKYFAKKGVKELILIAQDLSYYGIDIYKEQKLPELVEKLSDIEGIEIIRLHYAYPANFPEDILRVMKEKNNVAKYLDIPFQHISDSVLARMKRRHDKKLTVSLINKMRKEVPGIAIRTTLLVGFPGETEKDFEELKEFVKEMRFDRLGVFTYSEEENTYGGDNYEDDVPEDVKQARADEIMEIQQQISYEINQQKIGKEFNVIIDKETEDYYIGRTEFDSPEVDNEVLIVKDNKLIPGNIYKTNIISAEEFDLYGELV